MAVINWIIGKVVALLGLLLPVLGIPDSFINALDGAIATFITILQSASFFVPLDVLVACLTVMLIADNFSLFMKIGQFIINLIRG